MGTLFEQQKRNYYRVTSDEVVELIKEMKRVSDSTNIDFTSTLAVYNLLEKRRESNIKVWDGDVKDEQLAGFGEILKGIELSIESIASKD